MKELYLNEADGRKPKKLTDLKLKNPERLYRDFTQRIQSLLSIDKGEFLGFAQNATTNLLYIVLPILKKKKNYKIYMSAHEIKWYKKLFDAGRLPIENTTFPNYVKQSPISFVKKRVTLFDPEAFVKNPRKVLSTLEPAIIILSHVSRMTGEIFATQKLYKQIKSINKNNIIVIDGAQAIGALSCRPSRLSDVYIGVTSKFIGAEPHIGFCWVNRVLVKEYAFKEWNIEPKKFFREIYSTLEVLKKRRSWKRTIKEVRTSFDKKLQHYSIPHLKVKNQVPYIALIPIQKRLLAKKLQGLKKKGIIISSNTKWSIKEPRVPALRVSLTPVLSNKEIEYFSKTVSEI